MVVSEISLLVSLRLTLIFFFLCRMWLFLTWVKTFLPRQLRLPQQQLQQTVQLALGTMSCQVKQKNKQKTFFLLNFHVSLSKYCNSLDPKSPALSNLKFLANLIFLSINNLFKNKNTLVNRFVELIIYLQKNPKLLKLGQFKSFSSSKQLLSELDLGVQGIVLLKLCYLIPRNQLLKKKLMLNLLF